ncbi:sulfite exporter TauE/SafE family protein, partial [bacterium]|nr:sulfite exporter TauE/SafE family protein [bacterium]
MQTPELFLMLLAILVSSLVGSAHCVGMCGPFAVLVSRHYEVGHGQA